MNKPIKFDACLIDYAHNAKQLLSNNCLKIDYDGVHGDKTFKLDFFLRMLGHSYTKLKPCVYYRKGSLVSVSTSFLGLSVVLGVFDNETSNFEVNRLVDDLSDSLNNIARLVIMFRNEIVMYTYREGKLYYHEKPIPLKYLVDAYTQMTTVGSSYSMLKEIDGLYKQMSVDNIRRFIFDIRYNDSIELSKAFDKQKMYYNSDVVVEVIDNIFAYKSEGKLLNHLLDSDKKMILQSEYYILDTAGYILNELKDILAPVGIITPDMLRTLGAQLRLKGVLESLIVSSLRKREKIVNIRGWDR